MADLLFEEGFVVSDMLHCSMQHMFADNWRLVQPYHRFVLYQLRVCSVYMISLGRIMIRPQPFSFTHRTHEHGQ
jgi:hypothetical protein